MYWLNLPTFLREFLIIKNVNLIAYYSTSPEYFLYFKISCKCHLLVKIINNYIMIIVTHQIPPVPAWKINEYLNKITKAFAIDVDINITFWAYGRGL